MNLVERLAELVGFYSSYTGTFGEKVFAKDQAREALLSSMGYQLDEKSLTESINHLENYQWQNMLPSTHIVMLEEEHHFIKISIPENTDKNLHWKVITELSEEISGCITIC